MPGYKGMVKKYEPDAVCLVDDCDRPPSRRRMCDKHYTRWRVHGDASVSHRRQRPDGTLVPEGHRWCSRCEVVKPTSEFSVAARGPCVPCQREIDLRRLYGIGSAEYEELWASQGGCCALCRRPHSCQSRRLAVDHDHVSDKVRGLLCAICNRALAAFGDDLPGLLRAVAYLEGG